MKKVCTIIFVLIVAVATFLFFAWKNFYNQYGERSKPEIKIIEMPRGIGLIDTRLKFDLFDKPAGLDEVVVRTRQRGIAKEILRQSLKGESQATITIDFPGLKSGLEEGTVYVEIKVFDRSFWSNSSEESFALSVDYRKPKLEVLTSQHNARKGGSQLLFYRASDDNLAISGVKVGHRVYMGYPAKGLDMQFNDPNLYVVIYAVDLQQSISENDVRAFAEDRAGNENQVSFYNKISPRSPRPITIKLGEASMESWISALADESFQVLAERAKGIGYTLRYESSAGTDDNAIEKFQLVNTLLRDYSEELLTWLLKDLRFESYWNSSFSMPKGSIQTIYGDKQKFLFKAREIGESFVSGYEIVPPSKDEAVLAANPGIVLFAQDVGLFGKMVGIDHGLGIVSLYGHLSNVLVKKGDLVNRDQVVGLVGSSGFSRNSNLFFSMRVQGTPVDPIEWTDEEWFKAHITNKIIDMKKALGYELYKPLYGDSTSTMVQ